MTSLREPIQISNGAYEDGERRTVPIVFLAGPIKHWWTCWGSNEHMRYVAHRDFVRATLIEAGYLTYASWDAIKGTWDPRAQAINDVAIAISDLLVVMTPPGVPADGTEDETDYARRVQVPVYHALPGVSRADLLMTVIGYVGEGVPYAKTERNP